MLYSFYEEIMKVIDNNDWRIRYGIYEGDKNLSIYDLRGDTPVCLYFVVGNDIGISYFNMKDNPYDYNGNKRFSIDESCPIYPALFQLAEENIFDFSSGDVIGHTYSPVIKSDFNSATMQISKDTDCVNLDFAFEHYCDQGIDIKNVVYDGRSDIDKRHSDYKTRLVGAVNDAFAILDDLNPKEEQPLKF